MIHPPSLLLKNKLNLLFPSPPPLHFVHSFALSALIPRLRPGKDSPTAAFANFSGKFSQYPISNFLLTGENKDGNPTARSRRSPSEHHPHVPAGKGSQLPASAQHPPWLTLALKALLHMGCKCIIPPPSNREQQYLLNMSSFSALLCILPLLSRDKSTQTIIRISFVPNTNTFSLFLALTVTDFFPCVFNFLYQFSALDNF